MRVNLPNSDYFVGKQVPERPDVTIRSLVASGNNGHLFDGWSETLQLRLACKIIPRANLQHGADGAELWKAEVHKADRLRNTAVVRFSGMLDWRDPPNQIDCVLLIADYVDGPSLRDFIVKRPEEVSVSFVVQWLSTMLDLLHEMKASDVTHGDLHLGNILVEDRSAYSITPPRYLFRITDFGVAEATSDRQFKDDFFQLAAVLEALLNVIDSQALDSRGLFTFNILRHEFLQRHLVETDPTLDALARRLRELFQRLQEVDGDFERRTASPRSLVTPFDYLSCEQIGEDATLLRALYSDRFLGIEEVESQNNVVVTGPRGCGKTTVFRSLSLDQRMRVDEAEADSVRYIGVYYRCDDLYFAFPRYGTLAREDAVDVPMHFVPATLLAALIDPLEAWSRSAFPDGVAEAEGRAALAVWQALGIKPPSTPDAMTFKALTNRLNRERRKATDRYRFAHDPDRGMGQCFGPDVLPRACVALMENLAFLRHRPIYFFIDDYSSPKVTSALQHNLNRLLMQRIPVCFFKLSTESPVSFERQDIDGKVYVESREFVMQNLGLQYLRADVPRKLTFVEDVFRRRFERSWSSQVVRELEDLVGTNPSLNSNAMARDIVRGRVPTHWGKETLCELCSGDIHYIISLVSEMVRQAGGKAEIEGASEAPRIDVATQNQAIRNGAGAFLKNLRGVPLCGPRLVAIVEAFGAVAASHLRFLKSKNEKGTPQKQATRIEPYEPLQLSPEARLLYDELLRYSVFIEDIRGKSRRGNVVPRLYLRRFLIPHFGLTFNRRDSIELESKEFEEFLLDPAAFEQRKRIRNTSEAARLDDEDQLGLGIGGTKT